MKIFLAIIASVLAGFGLARTAQAVPPPDFIFNIGSQIAQIFTFIVLGFSLVIGFLRRFFQTSPLFVKHGKLMWTMLAVLVLALAVSGTYLYGKYKQDKEYDAWVQESRQNDSQTQADGLDALKLGQLQPISPRGPEPEDAGARFIKAYYQNLATGNTAAAYAVSSKTVPYETYQEWYKDTTNIKVDSLQQISENNYSLGLTLTDRSGTTRYAVLMRLGQDGAGGHYITRSDVRVLAQDSPQQAGSPAAGSPSFFEQNRNLDLSVSNEDFKNITQSQAGAYVLDAREDEEYEIGRFPGSTHIRFADLLAGEWIAVPQDRVVYVLCWSGIRGKEVAEFLRTKNIVARYLENGADGWVAVGGTWDGGIKFLSKYAEERYQIVFSTDQVRQYISQGVVMVDSRHPSKYQKRRIPGSVSIPVIYTPTSRMEQALAQVPSGSAVVTVCDDFVSCFDAKIAGVKLEKKGNTFLGRYNKPWEYNP